MAITTATNSTAPNVVKWPGTDGDPYDRATQLAGLAENFDLHDHSDTKNLGVKRLQTSAAPAASGEVGVISNVLQWWNGSAAASAMTNPMATTGDTIYGGASGAPARLAIGSTNDVLTVVAGVPAWRYPTLTTSTSHLSGDVGPLSTNTFTDTVSVSCVAGTWLIIAKAVGTYTGATYNMTARLYDFTGSANVDSAQHVGASTDEVSLTVFWVVTPSTTTTYKLQVAADQTISVVAACPTNGAGNTATGIVAVRIG